MKHQNMTTTSSRQTNKIEHLVERKKSSESKKKNVENYLIFGIIAFCLTLLVIVVTAGNDTNSDVNPPSKGSGNTINTKEHKDKAVPVGRNNH